VNFQKALRCGSIPAVGDGGNALERSGRGQPSHGAKVIEDIQKPRKDLLSLVVARKFDWPHRIFYRAFSLASGFRHNTVNDRARHLQATARSLH
jgi:hypothetical protein